MASPLPAQPNAETDAVVPSDATPTGVAPAPSASPLTAQASAETDAAPTNAASVADAPVVAPTGVAPAAAPQPPSSPPSLARRLRGVASARNALIAILALALALRWFGLDWDAGYGHSPHPDERAILFKVLELEPTADIPLLLDAENSPWNPRWFNYGSFPLYALKILHIFTAGAFGDDPNDIRLPARALSGLADIAAIAVVFGIAAMIYDRRVGLLAAALTAFAVIHIQLSHYFAVDTVQAALAVSALYFMLRVAREGRARDSAIAGALVGLGLATKASQLPIVAPFVIAHLIFALGLVDKGGVADFGADLRARALAAGKSAAVGVGALAAALLLAQPYMLLDFETFSLHFDEQSRMVRGIADLPYTRQYADTMPYLYHIRQLSVWGLGVPLGIIAWGGLLYVSLRGLRPLAGAAYLLAGWALPIGVLLLSSGLFAAGLAAAIALAALLATLPLRPRSARLETLLLCWVVPYFLITGSFHVKFMRYMLPIAPLLVLFGARMLFALWDAAAAAASSSWRRRLRPAAAALIAIAVLATAFYALAYINGVYAQTHTTVRASEWLKTSAFLGNRVVKEHWEESLPNLHGYISSELPMYETDTPAKTALVSETLADADYLYLWSNRLYGTIPRLPERYPIASEYYERLFDERLGYRLARVESNHPRLFGISFVDDTLSRPGLPPPDALSAAAPRGIALNLGYADESFTVYDHPTTLIFENGSRYDAGRIQAAIEVGAPPGAYEWVADGGGAAREIGLVYSPEDLAKQRRGDNWTDIVRPDGLASRMPALGWLVAMQIIGLAALPLSFVAFRSLPDRGYLFAKPLGLLLVGLIVWLLASLQWMEFSRGSVGVGVGVVALASLAAFARSWRDALSFARRRWRVLLTAEAVFVAAYFAFVLVRMANPDLWHPYRGGEKPMDFAYLNAALRSSIMPPYDPWFSGGYMNYYYWGQFLTAMLVRATGIAPVIAFNLAVPMYFAMTFGGAYAAAFNLAEAARRRLSADGERAVAVAAASALKSLPAWTPPLAGLAGAAFVAVMGNLDGAMQVAQGAARFVSGQNFGAFDFWRSSRMMPPDPPGHEITEFPYFTFLFGDLHAHLMALPFTLLAIGLSLAVVLAAVARARRHDGVAAPNAGGGGTAAGLLGAARRAIFSAEALRLALLGVAIGALRPLNTWDYPTYLIVGAASVMLAEYFAHGGLGLAAIIRAGAKSAFVAVCGVLAFLPYDIAYETFYNGIEPTTNTTELWQFLAIFGLFAFIIISFAADEFADGARRAAMRLRRGVVSLCDALNAAPTGGVAATSAVSAVAAAPAPNAMQVSAASAPAISAVSARQVAAAAAAALMLGVGLTLWQSGAVGGMVPFGAILFAGAAAVGVRCARENRPDAAPLCFALTLALVALALAIGLDFFRVEGDIDRMNSVFKFYLQAWVMLGLAAAYLLWRLLHGQRSRLWGMLNIRRAWAVALIAIIVSCAVYPALGTRARVADRFPDRFNGLNVTPLTLDGVAYMEGANYYEIDGAAIDSAIDLAADYEGIEWLNGNVAGAPVVMEGATPSYKWGGRVAMYTGLPTVIGWDWHQTQQRFAYSREVGKRRADVATIYDTHDAELALRLMRQYDVAYVYLGELERIYHPDGWRKFDAELSPYLDKVFDNGKTAIYRLGG